MIRPTGIPLLPALLLGTRPALLAVGGLALLLLAGTAPAAGEAIRRFDVDLTLGADGRYTVEETLVYDFQGSRRHGIFREIPLDRGRPWFEELPVRLEVEEVTDESGRARRYEVKRSGSEVRVRIGHPRRTVTGVQTYRLRYTVTNGVLFESDHDELYWNATGHEWSVPIEATRVTVHLPGDVAPSEVQTRCFTGGPGSTAEACDVETRDGSAIFTNRTRLGNGLGMTVAVALPKGTIAEPGAGQRLLERLRSLGGPWLLTPFAALAGMLGFWRRRGRDPVLGAAVPVRYEPPAGLSPAEVGTLIDESADMDDVTSTILDLAVRGYLRLEELTSRQFLFLSETDWRLVRLRDDDWRLKKHERRMLSGLFSSGNSGSTVKLSSLKTKFASRLAGIVDALYAELSGPQRHFVRSPRAVRRVWLSVAAGLVGLAVATYLGEILRGREVIWIAAAGGVVALFARAMPRRTRLGRQALEEILGFREFVARVDADRLEREGLRAPQHFERMLPYAIVLGVADHWADLFADLYTAPPDWYRSSGGGPFHPRGFVGDLGRAVHTMGRTLAAPAPNRGGSAFGGGGGGFSGGGFGGGGGGSW